MLELMMLMVCEIQIMMMMEFYSLIWMDSMILMAFLMNE